MNWLAFLMTGSAELASGGDEVPKTKPSVSNLSARDEDDDFDNGYVPLDETMGDPFAD